MTVPLISPHPPEAAKRYERAKRDATLSFEKPKPQPSRRPKEDGKGRHIDVLA